MSNFITIVVGNYNPDATYNLYLDLDCDGTYQDGGNYEGPTINIDLDDYGYNIGNPPGNFWCYKVCEQITDEFGQIREGCCCTVNNNEPPTEPLLSARVVRACCGVDTQSVFVEYFPPLPTCFISDGVAYSVGNEIPPTAPNYPSEDDVLLVEESINSCQSQDAAGLGPCPMYYVRCSDDTVMGPFMSSPVYFYPEGTGPSGDSFRIDDECYYIELGEVPADNEGIPYTLLTNGLGPEIFHGGCDECAGEVYVRLIRTCDTQSFTARIDNLATFDGAFGISVSAPFNLDGVVQEEDTCFLVSAEINETDEVDAVFDYNDLTINNDAPQYPGCGCEYYMFRCGLSRDDDDPYYKVTIENEHILYSYYLGETNGFNYIIEGGIGEQCVYLIPASYYENEPTPQFTDIPELNVSTVTTGGCPNSSNTTNYNCPSCTDGIDTMNVRGIEVALPINDYDGQSIEFSPIPKAGFIDTNAGPLDPNSDLFQQLTNATYNMTPNNPSYVIIPRYQWADNGTQQTNNPTGRINNGSTVQIRNSNTDTTVMYIKTIDYIGEYGVFDVYSIVSISANVDEDNYSPNSSYYLDGDIGELSFNY